MIEARGATLVRAVPSLDGALLDSARSEGSSAVVVYLHRRVAGTARARIDNAEGATAVQAVASVNGALLDSATATGATAVTVIGTGPLNSGELEADGSTQVSALGFIDTIFGSLEANGFTLVAVMFFPDMSGSDPIGLAVGLTGELAYLPLVADL